MKTIRSLAATLAFALLAGCGGGGGGGGTPETPELSLGALSPDTLNATLSDDNAGRFVQFTVSAPYTGAASGVVYVVVDDPDRVIASAVPAVGDGRASLTLDLARTVARGRYTQPVIIKVCKDAACTRQFAGSPQTLRKNIVVEGLTVGATKLDFSAPIGTGGPAQTLDVTPPAGKSYDFGTGTPYVEYTGPGGATSLILADRVFDITRTATGLQIKPKGAAAGRYTWPMAVSVPGYLTQVVNLGYDVAGRGAGPLTLLGSALTADARLASSQIVDLDALVNFPFTEIRFSITGTPDPVDKGWLLFHSIDSYTAGSGPADNARHIRFKFDACGYSAAFGCLGRGTYSASIRIDVVAFNETWTFTVPATFTVP